MAVMALETLGTFDPAKGNGLGYYGLVQFGDAAAESINTTTNDLKKMTALKQLDYVEKHIKFSAEKIAKKKIENLTDLYLSVLLPALIGKSTDKNYVLWDNTSMRYYNNPAFHKENGEWEKLNWFGKFDEDGNKIKKRGFEKTQLAKTYMWEVSAEINSWYAKGLSKKNKCKTDASTCEFSSSKGNQKSTGIWRNPIDNPQITIYTSGGNKRPWRSAFGDVRRDIRSAGLNHNGLDLFSNIGTNVFASLPGEVTTVDSQAGGAGHYIKIKVLDDYVSKFHELRRNYSPYYVKSVRGYDESKYDIKNYPDFIEQVGVTNSTEVHFVYMHLKSGSINVTQNETILESDYKTKVIAQTGDFGASGTKGPHLHFEIRGTTSGSRFNPAYYVNYKNETELTNAERKAQDTAAGK